MLAAMTRSVGGEAILAEIRRAGGHVPGDLSLWTLAERPGLADAVEAFGAGPWPAFFEHGSVADDQWPRLAAELPAFQLALTSGSGDGLALAAVARSAPMAWDGTDEGLPAGWDAHFIGSLRQLDEGVPPDTLGALMIVAAPDRRDDALGRAMVGAFRALARLLGYRAVIACVRPTLLDRYPLTPIDAYATWTRADGLPFDPWIRTHVRSGGRIVRPEPRSMLVEGSVEEWERWTGLAFPASGRYVIPGANATLEIDREADRGTHWDANVWIIHDL